MTLEERIAALEAECADLRALVEAVAASRTPTLEEQHQRFAERIRAEKGPDVLR